jgi:radical SAM superfamily enzyme YgiQ (UPF0313 family)
MARQRSRLSGDPFVAERLTRPLPTAGRRLRALVAAPAPYAVAMGGLSLQVVWEDLLATGDVDCRRACSEYPDGPALVPAMQLGGFDLIGLSLPYELDWLALPALLRAGGLAPRAAERRDDGPLVIAGGAAVTMNPEPLAEIVDAFVVGEAEPLIPALVGALTATTDRRERLAGLAALRGVYVPTLPPSRPISRLVWEGVRTAPRTSLALSPHSAFPDRFLIETGRGCPMGCRFCLARTVYQPVRHATRESLIAAASAGLQTTRKLGLIGASLSGYPGLEGLVGELVEAGAEVSLSSLRVDRITPELLAALRRGGQDTVTLAPEAGTEALRAAIGKPIRDVAIHAAVAAAADVGIRDVKLYFMVNLPGETGADREAVVDLVGSWVRDHPSLRFAVTLSPFVPKPWTPLEATIVPSLREAKATVDALADALRRRAGVDVRPGSPRLAAVQAALARGDRSVGRALLQAAEQGRGHAALKKALRAEGVLLDAELAAPYERPWARALGIGETCGAADGSEGRA